MASRKIKSKEVTKAEGLGIDIVEHGVALDAVAVVVHPSNPVSQLTIPQVMQIYQGKITNWSQVGGPDMAIVAYTRETTSGTYEVFHAKVMSKTAIMSGALAVASNGEMKQKVSQNNAAIGFVGLAYLGEDLKGIDLASDAGSSYVTPSKENVKNGSYSVTRTLYLYTNGQPTGIAKDFIDFMLSSDGQSIAEEIGYVAIT
jgi:phosphate transport system substrate-binding protein